MYNLRKATEITLNVLNWLYHSFCGQFRKKAKAASSYVILVRQAAAQPTRLK